MKKYFLVIMFVVAFSGFTQLSNALPLENGGFEAGSFANWSLTGTSGWSGSGVQTNVPDIGVHGGTYTGRIVSGLGVGIYTTLSQTFDLLAGDTLTGYYALRTSDRSYRDEAYAKINSGTASFFIWEEQMPVPVIVGMSWVGYTPWLEWSWIAPDTGAYTLEFGVKNVGNNTWNSIVYLDDITVTSAPPPNPVPEPSTLLLLGAGLLGLGIYRKQRSSKI